MHARTEIAAKTAESKREDSVFKAKRTDFSKSANSPVDHILHLQRTIGNQAVQRLFKSGVIQAKLKIGQPGDIFVRRGKYNPDSSRGRELLAHELTHFVQQNIAGTTQLLPGQKNAGPKTGTKQEGRIFPDDLANWNSREVKLQLIEQEKESLRMNVDTDRMVLSNQSLRRVIASPKEREREAESEERKKKQYPVRGHPKSPLSLEEIEKWLGEPIEKAGKNLIEFLPYLSQFAINKYEVPVVFPEEKIEHYGAKGPKKWVKLKGATYLTGTTTFVARLQPNDYLFLEYLQLASLWIVRHLGKERCENRMGELMYTDPKLKDRLRQKVVEK
ncbi:MAG: DUF4157 domain-containing protein [Deltaproteobacteria bacterium]|nr:DUF4157 domain-containing protein [Deltaproteobacteria bacterium]